MSIQKAKKQMHDKITQLTHLSDVLDIEYTQENTLDKDVVNALKDTVSEVEYLFNELEKDIADRNFQEELEKSPPHNED